MLDEPTVRRGHVAAAVAEEFPELRLLYATVAAGATRSGAEVRAQLRAASDRFTGPKAIALRQQPIPWAYRVFFRHIGIDPDERRTPIEAIAVERLRTGGFASHNLLADALLIATVETGVAIVAFDAAALTGEVQLRQAEGGERIGGDGLPVPAGRLVLADDAHAICELFGDVAPPWLPGVRSERVVLSALQVKGVPLVSVEEALWIVSSIVDGRP